MMIRRADAPTAGCRGRPHAVVRLPSLAAVMMASRRIRHIMALERAGLGPATSTEIRLGSVSAHCLAGCTATATLARIRSCISGPRTSIAFTERMHHDRAAAAY